jgi:hypothetical protein
LFGTLGEVNPIEASVVQHVSTMGRIVEYRSRISISYPFVTILVNNLPFEDIEKHGRLRDHLTVLAEATGIRAVAIYRDEVVERFLISAGHALDNVDQSQRNVQTTISVSLQGMGDRLERALSQTALTEQQESFLTNIVREGIDEVLTKLSTETDIQQHMTKIVNELKASSHTPSGTNE